MRWAIHSCWEVRNRIFALYGMKNRLVIRGTSGIAFRFFSNTRTPTVLLDDLTALRACEVRPIEAGATM